LDSLRVNQMIDEKVSDQIGRIFDSLKQTAKAQVFDDMKIIGIRIELGTDSWRNFMYQKSKKTKGKLGKLYSLMSLFEKEDVEKFFAAFTEHVVLDNAALPRRKSVVKELYTEEQLKHLVNAHVYKHPPLK
jgi:hypothetical protein